MNLPYITTQQYGDAIRSGQRGSRLETELAALSNFDAIPAGVVTWFGAEDNNAGDAPDANIAVIGNYAYRPGSDHVAPYTEYYNGSIGYVLPDSHNGYQAIRFKALASGWIGIFTSYFEGFGHRLRAYVNNVYRPWSSGSEYIGDQGEYIRFQGRHYEVFPIGPWWIAAGPNTPQTGYVDTVRVEAGEVLSFRWLSYPLGDPLVPAAWDAAANYVNNVMPHGALDPPYCVQNFDDGTNSIGGSVFQLYRYDFWTNAPTY